MRVLVVNLNNLKFTKDCIDDLLNQSVSDFKITLVDQASNEENTVEYLDSLPNRIDVIKHTENIPLNAVWNWFATTYDEEYLCFLNNDVRLTNNFIEDIIFTLNNEESVGIVVHATNHPDYNKKLDVTKYVIAEPHLWMQGWDFTIRRSLWRKIPVIFKTYCGDDFQFDNVYQRGLTIAFLISSPIIHYEGMSKKFMKTSGIEDVHLYIERGYKHYLKINQEYSKIKPTFNQFLWTK